MSVTVSIPLFETLPDHARLWVYQSSRPFSAKDKQVIDQVMTQFISQWAAHGQQLKASFTIEYDQFIVLAVDEQQALASGCSIDASVGAIKHLEQHLGLSLLDRTQVAFLVDEQVELIPFNKVKSAIAENKIKPDTTIFNNAVSSMQAWKSDWKQVASSSWVGRHFG